MRTVVRPPGRAGERIEALGERARLCGVYDETGASVYHDLAAADAFEVQEIIRAVRATTGPVLDLAAGSGRITFPLLAMGREVTALDLSADMLAILTRKLDTAPPRLRDRGTVVQADMSTFDLRKRFGAVVLGTTSLSMLDPDGRAGLYRAVTAHLAPGAQFVLSVLERGDTSGPDEEITPVVGASGAHYDLHEYWPVGAPSRKITIFPTTTTDGEGPVTVCTDEVHTPSLAQVERELVAASFEISGRRPLTEPGGRYQVTLLKAVLS